MKEIVYEPHPVSAGRKAELIGQGFKIVDAIFAPVEEAPKDKPAMRGKREA